MTFILLVAVIVSGISFEDCAICKIIFVLNVENMYWSIAMNVSVNKSKYCCRMQFIYILIENCTVSFSYKIFLKPFLTKKM